MAQSLYCRVNRFVLYLTVFGLILFASIFFSLNMLSSSHGDLTNFRSLHSYDLLDTREDFLEHLDDMQRVQKSVIIELAKLEKKRGELKNSADEMEVRNTATQKQLNEMEASIRQIQVNIAALQVQQAEILSQYPAIVLPHKLIAEPDHSVYVMRDKKSPCQLESCFDYSRCSVLSGFPIYIYPSNSQENDVQSAWRSALELSTYATNLGETACLYIVIGEFQNFKELQFWRGDGRNHLLLNPDPNALTEIETHRAIRAQPNFLIHDFQPKFDIILPHMTTFQTNWNEHPLILPARRRLSLSFYGNKPLMSMTNSEKRFLETLMGLGDENPSVKIVTECEPVEDCADQNDWCTCKDDDSKNILRESTFTLIISSNSTNLVNSQTFARLFAALKQGAIPVILGDSDHMLPYNDIIKWSSATLQLAKPRITELLYILRNIMDEDLVELRRQGRVIFDTYFSSIEKTSEALLTVLLSRLQIPLAPMKKPVSTHMYSESVPMRTYKPNTEPATSDEILGPVEKPFPSVQFVRNFTSWKATSGLPAITRLYPSTPWDPLLPTDAKFHGSSYGFRPINGGTGGTGKEFALSLGGNSPREQFTIVVLTYDRPDLLQQMLTMFKGLPYLNKVLIVWNNPTNPTYDFQWPEIGVPIQVLKASRNSLNNRFLPYDEIETEAVLSVDDDMYLRQDEIVFAFRVWRESRDKLVGFPGRYHAWDSNGDVWNYNSNHSCELSMILTGAAFIHKYYLYQYSYNMHKAIRDKVDEYMNCEDLAMNFLIAHLTRKPPIKVTSRWTFRCPTCGELSLWTDESHFQERHKCINFFTQVYGYLPLMYTQYRADSVLFKTRVPADKTKCFSVV